MQFDFLRLGSPFYGFIIYVDETCTVYPKAVTKSIPKAGGDGLIADACEAVCATQPSHECAVECFALFALLPV